MIARIHIAQGWNRNCTGLLATLLALGSLSAGAAELRFSRCFGDHMVLQRDKKREAIEAAIGRIEAATEKPELKSLSQMRK